MPGRKDDKRSFSRFPIRFRAMARIMEEGDAPLYRGAPAADPAQKAKRMQSSGLPQAVVEFLVDMDHKLDQIIGRTALDELAGDFPLKLEAYELSGSGMRFKCKQKLDKDARLEAVLLLGQYPLRTAGSVGRVQGVSKGMYRFEFTDMRDADQETVIQFLFQEQRQQIRSQRLHDDEE